MQSANHYRDDRWFVERLLAQHDVCLSVGSSPSSRRRTTSGWNVNVTTDPESLRSTILPQLKSIVMESETEKKILSSGDPTQREPSARVPQSFARQFNRAKTVLYNRMCIINTVHCL